MTDVEIAWFAGIFEGEGCIATTRSKYPWLQVAMSDEDVIRRLHSVSGCGTVRALATRPGYKPMWEWRAGKRTDVARLLCAMAPLLGERRRAKALEAADLLKLRERKLVAQCGTHSGYVSHRKRKEKPCADCTAAVREYNRAYVARRLSGVTIQEAA